MRNDRIGALIGGVAGFLLGASINIEWGADYSLWGRITGGVILQDLQGLAIGLGQAIGGMVIVGMIGAAVGIAVEEVWKLIRS